MTAEQQLRISGADQDSINALLQDYLDTALEEEDNEQPFVLQAHKRSATEYGLPGPSLSSSRPAQTFPT